ncbi:unnamed protein product [Callosobruchus maculatus]|uniref:Uncharacterized protein n=1 Tax=Callosobruchus maculatus TaxID=64391 RepID=A0A653CC70_CALMS|nr:unnamed protein product [Callosobruchus maculatus]
MGNYVDTTPLVSHGVGHSEKRSASHSVNRDLRPDMDPAYSRPTDLEMIWRIKTILIGYHHRT